MNDSMGSTQTLACLLEVIIAILFKLYEQTYTADPSPEKSDQFLPEMRLTRLKGHYPYW